MQPLVSIIMPVYNSELYLDQAIKSCLNQTYKNFELILIDDNSIDNSLNIINCYKMKYPQKIKVVCFEKNQGPAIARNKGLDVAEGEYVVFADSDDIQHKNRLQKVIKAFNLENVDMVFNNCQMIDEAGKFLGKDLGFPEDLDNNALLLSIQRNYFYVGLSSLINKKIIKFDENLKYSEDYDLFLNLIYKGYRFSIINEPLTRYRIHRNNTSRNYKGSKEAVKQILSKYDFEKLYTKLKLQGHPEADIYNALGIASITKENFEQAIDFLMKARNISGSNRLDTIFYLGVANFKKNRIDQAYLFFDKAYKLRKDDPTILNNLGVVLYLKTKNKANSVELFKKALLLTPEYMDAKQNLEDLLSGNTPDKITEKFLRKNLVHTSNIK